MRNYKENETGYTLVSALLILSLFSILGMSIIGITSNSVKMSDSERDDQSTYYIAEAGVAKQVAEIEQSVKLAFDTINAKYNAMSVTDKLKYNFEDEFYKEASSKIFEGKTTLSTFSSHFGKNPEASINVSRVGMNNPPVYLVESIGYIGKKNRTVMQEVEIRLGQKSNEGSGNGEEYPSMTGETTVHVKNTIKLSGSAKIKGNASTESNDPNAIMGAWDAKVEGEKIFNAISPIELPLFPSIPKYTIPENQKLTNKNGNTMDLIKDGKLLIDNYVTNGYILDLKKSTEFNEIILNSNYTLTIDVGDSDKEIVVNHLNVLNGHINIVGDGKLTIYVKEKMTMGSGSTINANTKDSKRLQVFQKGTNEVRLSGRQKIYGSLYAEKANIYVKNGGGFQGNIFSGGSEVEVDGGTQVNTQLFLVPNAKFTLGGSGLVKGAIIAESFIGSGNGLVTFGNIDSDLIPHNPPKNYGDGSDLISKSPYIEK